MSQAQPVAAAQANDQDGQEPKYAKPKRSRGESQRLSATDRAVDRARARVRAEKMARTMQSVPFEQLEESLPQLAFTMMQNVTDQEKQVFANELAALREKRMDTVAKSISLGLSLSNIVGQGVVDDAVTALRKTLAAAGDPSFSATLAPARPTENKEAPVPPAEPK